MINLRKNLILLLLSCIALPGCMSGKNSLYKKLSKEDPHNTHYKGHYKIGKEYKVKGKTYSPKKNIKYDQVGMASWYGKKHGFHGKKTANGDKYNKQLLTAAHKSLPLPSMVKVTNLKNNKSLILVLNDRGPFSKGRILDVSEKAADILGFKKQGIAKVRVQYLHKETQEFLHNIALNDKPGSKAKRKVKNPRCSVNCHVKLVNIKNKLSIE